MKAIIVGAGEVGFHSAKRLAAEGKEVVVIDTNPRVLERIEDNLDVQVLEGSGSSPGVLERAGIADAELLLAVTDSDETNLVACTFANMLAPGMTKLARIRNEEYTRYRDKLARDLSLNMVVNPDVEVVRKILSVMEVPGAAEISEFAEGRVKLVGMSVNRGSILNDTRLSDVREKTRESRLLIAAIVRDDDLIIPTGDDRIVVGDLVYFVCPAADLGGIFKKLGNKIKTRKNVLIIGGGNIGRRLALALDNKSVHAKLLDCSSARCEILAEELSRVVVLKGDGTDQEVLLEENIKDMDVVVSVTGNEESNILASLLAKKLGAGMTITRINKTAYMPLVRAIGLEHLVSPRMSAVSSILQHVRHGVLSSVSIKEDAEALEVIVEEKSKLTDKRIQDLPFPKGALVLSIVRGDAVIVPRGDDVIRAGDRLILLAVRKNIAKLEKALTVRVEQV